jgi:AcrR family transcriptional regulator
MVFFLWQSVLMPDRPRQERWLRTRRQIVEAALDVLVTHGYAGLTMQRVQDVAGVSRGALTHHFGSMAELAASAVEAVADRQTSAISTELREGRGAVATVEQLVDALLSSLRQETYAAGLDLWCAARVDDALREALLSGARRMARTHRQLIAEVLGLDPESPQARLAADGLLSLMRGLALGAVLRPHGVSERAALTAWLASFDATPTPLPGGTMPGAEALS